MKRAHIRDAVALIELADILETEMKMNVVWDELKAAKKLKQLRGEQKHNRGLSFPTISAYGGNGAVIHYKPNNVTNTRIGYDAFYLLDSGTLDYLIRKHVHLFISKKKLCLSGLIRYSQPAWVILTQNNWHVKNSFKIHF